MRYKNLVLIGTSHIARESLKEVEEAIEKESPEIVALELDKQRLFSLLDSKRVGRLSMKDIKRIGIKGYIFSIIGSWIERKLGEKVGVSPGSEMLSAYRIAKKKNLQIALIDQNIEITLKRFSQALSWREKLNFLVDLFKGLVLRQEEIKIDLARVPDEKLIIKLLKQVKDRYPNIYKVLVEERNNFMASKLASMLYQFPNKKIVAVVGAGHEAEIIALVKKYINELSNV